MESVELNCSLREAVGKKESRKLRKKGLVPCVLYGGTENVHFMAHENEFRKIVYTPNIYLLKIKINGMIHNAIIKEIQFHPVTDRISHIDFYEFKEDKEIIIQIPVRTEGFSEGVKEGGSLRIDLRYLTVRALTKHLPDFVTINVEAVKLGQNIKVRDIQFDHIKILDPPNTVIVSVKLTRMSKSMEEVPVEAAAATTAIEGAEAAPAKEGEAKKEDKKDDKKEAKKDDKKSSGDKKK